MTKWHVVEIDSYSDRFVDIVQVEDDEEQAVEIAFAWVNERRGVSEVATFTTPPDCETATFKEWRDMYCRLMPDGWQPNRCSKCGAIIEESAGFCYECAAPTPRKLSQPIVNMTPHEPVPGTYINVVFRSSKEI